MLVNPSSLFAANATAVQIGGSISERDYPKDALKRGVEGDILVSFQVSAKGKVENCKGNATSDPDLVSGSCKVVNRFKFRPATAEDGTKIAEQRAQSFAWRISSQCPPSRGTNLICVNLERPKR